MLGFQVFQCVNGTCGYFYHPHCVAKALQFKRGDKATDFEGDLEGEIAAGKAFVCPIHTCFGCKEPEPEDKNDLQLQFAVCRRCPRAYHRKCLPGYFFFMEFLESTGLVYQLILIFVKLILEKLKMIIQMQVFGCFSLKKSKNKGRKSN